MDPMNGSCTCEWIFNHIFSIVIITQRIAIAKRLERSDRFYQGFFMDISAISYIPCKKAVKTLNFLFFNAFTKTKPQYGCQFEDHDCLSEDHSGLFEEHNCQFEDFVL